MFDIDTIGSRQIRTIRVGPRLPSSNMSRRQWGNAAYYVMVTAVGLYATLVGINAMGHWGSGLGWGLLALWGTLTALAISVRLRLDRRRRGAGKNTP